MSPVKPEKRLNVIKKTALAIVVFAFVLFVGRGLYPYVHGPSISVNSISNGAVVTDPAIRISGTATHTKELLVGGRSLALSTDGSFDETILLHPGYNIISIIGTDRFGKSASRDYAIVLNDQPDSNVAMKYPVK